MKIPGNYFRDLAVRMAHHSTAIEGNTLTQGETKSILIDGIIPRQMDEREYWEVFNYRKYTEFLSNHYTNPISMDIIRETHALLLLHIRDDNGSFKKTRNVVLGASFTPSEPYQVIEHLKNWTDTLSYRLDIAKTKKEKIEAIMESHLRFEQIHPFSDGNGRTGRALIVHSCLNEGIAPIVIEKGQRNEYIAMLNNEDILGLAKLGYELHKKEAARLRVVTEMER